MTACLKLKNFALKISSCAQLALLAIRNANIVIGTAEELESYSIYSYFLSISAMDFPDDFSISLAAISVNFVANTFFFIALFTTHIILPMCKSRWYCDAAS